MTRSLAIATTTATLPVNTQDAIGAQQLSDILVMLATFLLAPDDLVHTPAGNSVVAPFSQAGAYALQGLLTTAIGTACANLKAELLGGAGAAWDTLQELHDLQLTDENVVALLTNRIGLLELASQLAVKANGSVPFTAPVAGVVGTQSASLATVAQVECAGQVFALSAGLLLSGTATGTYDLGVTRATETGQTAKVTIPEALYVTPKSLTGTIATAATLTVGTNAPAYDNILSRLLTNVTTLGVAAQLPFNAVLIPPGTPIKARISAVQLGGTATYDVALKAFQR